MGSDRVKFAVMSEIDSEQTLSDNSGDWPARTSQTVVQYVGVVRDKTTGPALVASRYAVYFVAIGLLALVIAVLLLILLLRILVLATGALPFVEMNQPWLAYIILGVLCSITGLFLWKKRVSTESK